MNKFENYSARMEAEGKRHELFDTLVHGRFERDAIRVSEVEPHTSRERTSESDAYIDTRWKDAIAEGKIKPWPNDEKPSRYGFVDAKTSGGVLQVTLDPSVTYKDYYGSAAPGFLERFGKEMLPNPLGVATVIISHDKRGERHILVTLRSEKHDYKPAGHFFGTGGFVSLGEHPFDTAERETIEEAGLAPEDITKLLATGVVFEPHALSTTMTFVAETSCSPSEIITRRKEKAKQKGLSEAEAENSVLFIPATRQKIQEWMLAPAHAGAEVSYAAVMEAAREIVGEEKDETGQPLPPDAWVRQMNAALSWRMEQARRGDPRAYEARDRERLRRKVVAFRQSGDLFVPEE